MFDINDLINTPADSNQVKKYYEINQLAYTLFYNNLDFMHMGISFHSKLKKSDLYKQAKFISKYVESLNHNDEKKILELGSGKGGNSIYLSKKFSEINFLATDLTKKNIDFLRKKKV